MTRRLFLIVEDKTDVEVFKRFLELKNLSHIKIEAFGRGGISHLQKDLDNLLLTALAKRNPGDCIVVLHDADQQTGESRKIIAEIKQICKRYSNQGVLHLEARDEIESWLLSDEGFCKWLGIRAKNEDSQNRPSGRLKTLLNDKKKKPYQAAGRQDVLNALNGNCHSESFKQAFKQLEEAGCLGS
jgi:hypothetical protein